MSFYSITHFIKEFYPQYYGVQSYPASKCITIHKIDDEWGVFCNFAKTPLLVDDVTFKSSEELFQLMKFKNADIIGRITQGITNNRKVCHQIKRTVKSYEKEYRREDWGEMVVDAMKFCLQTKHEQCEEFRMMLKKSEGYYIVEDQSSFPKKNADAWGVKLIGEEYVGPNLLGRLLMELREHGSLEYILPDDAFEFISVLKEYNKMIL